MKGRWRASVAAIVRRAFDVGLIGAAQYQRAYKHMSGEGWLRGEPPATEPEFEPLFLLPNSFVTLRGRRGISMRDVAKALHWKLETLEKVTGIDAPPESEKSEPKSGVVAIEFARKRRIGQLGLSIADDEDDKS